MELGVIYFYTATILHWQKLLETEKYKQIIIESIIYLIRHSKIKVYGFVIMPNHIHLLFENTDMNGKEMPYVSLMKYTAHQFLQQLRKNDPELLNNFKVDRNTRVHQFWQRNALPVAMYDRKIFEQKLDYIHLNPLQEHWQLATDPNDYRYSSCSFYEKEDIHFNWLSHYRDTL
ncbi:transposase [Mucilaginibacter sp. PPCGB 2223]|uniref:transposase n=1 Tax=Mucilaginibacter sp. PPCGB 2223 TaxID=1886027 RepID=UPI0008256C89|nr:transposase [Mucilaginibacter sp. PPCGB 2223]OCX51323.1 transposase [Mucilaginibacter sp. PPCGB 2223]